MIDKWIDGCPYCGSTETEEGNIPQVLHCPVCGRDGCDECMPAGRGCECPECEPGEDD